MDKEIRYMARTDVATGANPSGTVSRASFLRQAGLGATGVALGGALPGLLSPGSANAAVSFTGGTLHVSYWTNITPLKDLVAVLNGFGKKYGMTVKYDPLPVDFGDDVTKLTTYLSSGYTGLDVLWLDDFMTASFGTAGWLEPLEGKFSKEVFTTVAPATIKLSTYNGHIVRLPANSGNVVFFYRKDLFDKEGLSVPRTWADVVKAGKRLTKGGVYGLGFVGKNGNTQLFNELSYWIGQAGGDAIHLKTSAARATLKFIYDMLHTYKIMPSDTVTNTYTTLQTSFEEGHIAMWPTWAGILGPLLPGAKAGGGTKYPVYGKTAIALPPRGPKNNSSITASWGWSISKFSKNKDTAVKFIEYATMPQSEVTLALTASEPARISLLSNPTVQGTMVWAKYDAMYNQKTTMRSRPITAQAQRISDAMEAVINRYLNKQIGLDAAINEAQQRIDQILRNA
jgi:multiple sugar transport system substrate-binding protein